MDQALVLISFARLGYERGHGIEAVAAGRRAWTFAERHAFPRLSLFARLETARILVRAFGFNPQCIPRGHHPAAVGLTGPVGAR